MKGLGGLEAEVMKRLWTITEPQSVHDLVERLSDRKKLAYTTVLTVVTHLHDKGWVTREKRQRAYFYFPSRSAEEAQSAAVRELLDSTVDSAAVLEQLARTMSDAECAAIRRGWDSRSALPIDAD
ncbi:BlaI/MecI/CopY family transcriptional regulator [Antrihabitans cavernicola]|uniref:BlaI/MecI/CopY family transcriptional regulator n=1 Tax=Antrihabitans cavernicola TaxID=2495913 RepID=A0A5A7S7H0_9NOCA|nr:BlaI/MecI/CopY family transcriptional regulator [Spelaeibacter cavernicola]KAA0021444.1 BlaI/MecI/CopY family transcriptional regulator [Spelaeibacter cavernicola]